MKRPLKRVEKNQGKMEQPYFWPVYGEDHEVVFTFSESRGKQHIVDTLSHEFRGTLVTDGYAAYARYAEKTEGIIHAQCWVHSHRYLVNAEERSPQEVAVVLEIIGQLYQLERLIVDTKLSGDKKRSIA
jgi:transposase